MYSPLVKPALTTPTQAGCGIRQPHRFMAKLYLEIEEPKNCKECPFQVNGAFFGVACTVNDDDVTDTWEKSRGKKCPLLTKQQICSTSIK